MLWLTATRHMIMMMMIGVTPFEFLQTLQILVADSFAELTEDSVILACVVLIESQSVTDG